jgi:hypothetical protein
MSTTLTLGIRVGNGQTFILKITSTMSAGAILNIPWIRPPASCTDLLVHKGRTLDRNLSLEFQGVHDGDTVAHVRFDLADADIPEPTTSRESKVRSVLLETLKINDSFYRPFESDRFGQCIFGGSTDSIEGGWWRDFPQLQDETVIPQNPQLSVDPLPPLEEDPEDDSSDDDELPQFESFKEAGEFFSKLHLNKWRW